MKMSKINTGSAYIGIKFGSTRVKAVPTDDSFSVPASGAHTWENMPENGCRTYSPDDIKNGMRAELAAAGRE